MAKWLVLPSDLAFVGTKDTMEQAHGITVPTVVELPENLVPSCVWATFARCVGGSTFFSGGKRYRTDLNAVLARKVDPQTPAVFRWGFKENKHAPVPSETTA